MRNEAHEYLPVEPKLVAPEIGTTLNSFRIEDNGIPENRQIYRFKSIVGNGAK